MMKHASTAYGKFFSSCRTVTMPADARKNTTTGISKAAPKARNIVVVMPKTSLIDQAACTNSFSKADRNANMIGNTNWCPNSAPVTKSSVETTTNGTANFFSVG